MFASCRVESGGCGSWQRAGSSLPWAVSFHAHVCFVHLGTRSLALHCRGQINICWRYVTRRQNFHPRMILICLLYLTPSDQTASVGAFGDKTFHLSIYFRVGWITLEQWFLKFRVNKNPLCMSLTWDSLVLLSGILIQQVSYRAQELIHPTNTYWALTTCQTLRGAGVPG